MRQSARALLRESLSVTGVAREYGGCCARLDVELVQYFARVLPYGVVADRQQERDLWAGLSLADER
jgi:hypothetical protein